MLIVVSPAKKLDMRLLDGLPSTAPIFKSEKEALIEIMRSKTEPELQKLMQISAKLAQLNAERYANFGTLPRKQAMYAFSGDTYQGLEANSLDADEQTYAQDHLRILSGLYGVLRPMDKIEPYRLEMGTRLLTERGKSLYQFWGESIAHQLNEDAKACGTDVLVNCASQEYFKAAGNMALKPKVVTPQFLEDKDGTVKMVSFFAKRARGAMARFIIQNRLQDPADLQDFNTGGYAYDPGRSTPEQPTFVRPA